jgi:hypothetical protein
VTDLAIYKYLRSINSPRSLAVWLLYESGEHKQLVDLKVNPLDFVNPEEFRNAYLATEFLSKATFLKTGLDLKAEAMSKFSSYEEKCGTTNRAFRNLPSHPKFSVENVRLLSLTRRKIASILGSFGAEEIIDLANWGPGVSTLVKGEEVSAFNKFRDERGITSDLYSLIRDWFHVAYPLWRSSPISHVGNDSFVHQSGNTVITVPKNSKTDRVIAVEPGINLWFQQSIGNVMVRRLRRVGVDLTTQENNQFLAKLSSRDDSLATIDFSSASDSIADAVVEDLLPKRWYTLMNSVRSQYRQGEIAPIKWNKFSSMGNAFTFPLQSLIFYAAAWACCQTLRLSGSISVFGDDVIIPKDAFSLFSSFTDFLGFDVNPKKSFSSGLFRESCGSHYFDAVNCKPFYLKDRISTVKTVYRVANGVRLVAHRCMSEMACDERFKRLHDWLVTRIPKPLRFRVPKDAGDIGFISNFDEATPVKARHGIEGYRFNGLIERGVTRETDDPAILLARLWVPSTEDPKLNTYDLRGRVRLAIKRGMLVQRWYQLGIWI